MKKKGKQQRQQPPGRPPAARPTADPEALARSIESALARGELDAAAQRLSEASPPGTVPLGRDLYVAVYLAQASRRWEQPVRAQAWLERAVEAAPDRADLRRLYGNLLRRSGSAKRAVAELEEAHRLAPGDPSIAYELLLARLARGDRNGDLAGLAGALPPPLAGRAAALLAALGGDPAAAERALATARDRLDLLMLGVARLTAGDAEGALPLLQAGATREELPRPARAHATLYLGVALARLRRPGPAAEALERARDLGAPADQASPFLAWAYQQLAIEAVLSEHLEEAAGWLERLADLGGPEAGEARDTLVHALAVAGQELARAGDYDEAASSWQRALEANPQDLALRQNLAVALERAGRTDEAIPHWHELVRQAPRALGGQARGAATPEDAAQAELRRHLRAVAHRHLADLYAEQEDLERAVEQMERAVQAAPTEVDLRRDLARLLMEDGQYRKAVAHYEQVVAASPANAEERMELGQAYLHAGDYRRGLQNLEAALALQPESPILQLALARALIHHVVQSPGAPTAIDEARRALALASARRDTAAAAAVALGAAQLARGDRAGAEKSFRKAVRQSVDKTGATIEIGHVYWKSGDREAAAATWANAMKRTKRGRFYYPLLVECWALAGDVARCRESLLMTASYQGAEVASRAVESAAGIRGALPTLRQAVRELAAVAEDAGGSLEDMASVAEMLVHVADAQGARALLNRVGRQAVQEEDEEAVNAVIAVDYLHRLLDRKVSMMIAEFLDLVPDRPRPMW